MNAANTSYIHWLRSLIGHRKTIITYGVVVLRNEQGQVLLQRRMDFDVWGLPGGVMEPGETILDCARRETLEETGLEANALRLVGIYTDPSYDTIYPNGDQVQQYSITFEGRVSGGEMHVDGMENSAQAFFDPQDIPFDNLPIFYRHMLQDALRAGPPVFEPPFTRPQNIDIIQELRPLIGHTTYIGAGATAVITNEQGNILMVRHSDDGKWALPGGHTQLGENAAYTAVREAREETGLEIAIERILGIYTPTTYWVYPNSDQVQWVIAVFKAHVTGGALHPDHTETSQAAWMTPQEVLAAETPAVLHTMHQAVIDCLRNGTFVL